MQESESHDYFGDYIPDDVFGEKDVLLTEVEIEISHGEVLHNDVDIGGVLEGFLDACEEEVVFHLPDHLALQHIVLAYLGLVYDLHRVALTALFLLHQHHTPERPLAEIFDALVVGRSSPCLLVDWLQRFRGWIFFGWFLVLGSGVESGDLFDEGKGFG